MWLDSGSTWRTNGAKNHSESRSVVAVGGAGGGARVGRADMSWVWVGVLRPVGIWGHLDGENIQSYTTYSVRWWWLLYVYMTFSEVHGLIGGRADPEGVVGGGGTAGISAYATKGLGGTRPTFEGLGGTCPIPLDPGLGCVCVCGGGGVDSAVVPIARDAPPQKKIQKTPFGKIRCVR